MSYTLADLIARLLSDVPAVNGRPTAEQYDAAVRSAVGQFSNRSGMVKRVQINVVSGTASYTLPDDFLNLIKFDDVVEGSVLVQPGGGLIPLGPGFALERYTIAGRTLTLIPTPGYTLTRGIWYKAGHALDASDAYPDMTEDMADIVLVKAAANALRYLGVGVAGDGWKYSIGDVAIDKSGQPRSYREIANTLDAEFDQRVKDFVGPVGVRATYSTAEMNRFRSL